MSGGRRAILTVLLLALGLELTLASPAAAEFGPIQLVSKGAAQQADVALAPALSADGRYLAFQGRLGAAEGIFREDLRSGAITRVVVASPAAVPASGRDAAAPSISADGRYVSFTTSAPLDPDDDLAAASRDVYVADLATSPPTYELASALDGCDPGEAAPHSACGLAYENGPGSEASGRVALSADGSKVVFVTSAESNLTSGAGGSTEGVPTPARQVVLRDLERDRTTLVSAERDAASGEMTEKPVVGGALLSKSQLPLLRGAALSADGTTVAWIGTHLSAQVALLAGEAKTIAELDAGSFPYDEPLWRRMADGPSAPIRRVVAGDGGADPFPQLTAKSTEFNLAEGWLGVEAVNGVPQLSADGRQVALIGNPSEATNLFVVDMAAGLSRAQALRQLTREIVVDPTNPGGKVNRLGFVQLNGHVFDAAISSDGEKVALATARQRFPLAPPNLIGSPPATLGLVELYVIDRASETLKLVTHGVAGLGEPSLNPVAAGQPAGQAAIGGAGASAPSFGGGLVAFASTASNLTVGDGNEASDAFVVEDRESARRPGAATIAPAPASGRHPRRWRLTLSALSLADGSVRIVATVPAAGGLRAKAGAEPGGELAPRRLAGARVRAPQGGRVAIELRLPRDLRQLARTREGVYAMAQVSFHRQGRKTLRGRVQIRFHAHPRKKTGEGR